MTRGLRVMHSTLAEKEEEKNSDDSGSGKGEQNDRRAWRSDARVAHLDTEDTNVL